MKIILPHKIASKKVETLAEIREDINGLLEMLKNNAFVKQREGFAIHHSQITKSPKDFFVVHPKIRRWFGGHGVICNARLLERSDPREFSELCLSYPFRPAKKTRRHYKCTVKCEVESEIPNKTGLKTITIELEGMPAYILAHEMDHAKGRFIYD